MHLLVILAWVLNPFLALFGLSLLISQDRYSRFLPGLLLTTALLIGSAIILYQVTLPLPSDLKTSKEAYFSIAPNFLFGLALIKRDLLSNGLMVILANLFPKFPISFYLLHMVINFACLWAIFRSEAKNQNLQITAALLLALFLGFLDHSESHHFLRQTTALLILLSALTFHGKWKWVGMLVACLWHGSMLLPTLSLVIGRKLLKLSKKQKVVFIVAATSICYGLSYVNFYEYFSAYQLNDGHLHWHLQEYSFLDRFIGYFRRNNAELFFAAARETGNPGLWLSIIIFASTHFYRLKRNCQADDLTIVATGVFLLLVFFQFNVLLFPRLEYFFFLLTFYQWIRELKIVPSHWQKLLPCLIFVLCLIRIHYFTWPLTTKHEDRYLFLRSPVALLADFARWPINQ